MSKYWRFERINSIYVISFGEMELDIRTNWKSNRLLERTVFDSRRSAVHRKEFVRHVGHLARNTFSDLADSQWEFDLWFWMCSPKAVRLQLLKLMDVVWFVVLVYVACRDPS
jgi:hypothetical protein